METSPVVGEVDPNAHRQILSLSAPFSGGATNRGRDYQDPPPSDFSSGVGGVGAETSASADPRPKMPFNQPSSELIGSSMRLEYADGPLHEGTGRQV